MDKQQIFEKIRTILIDEFELDPEKIVPTARLYEDLKFDSIDAVDLIVKFKSMLPHNVDPEVFKSLRTLQDVVDALDRLFRESGEKK